MKLLHPLMLAPIALSACPLLAQLAVTDSFPIGAQGVSIAFDHTAGEVWTYSSFASSFSRYSPAGGLVAAFARPGESANDVDLEITAAALTLGSTQIPEGTPLFINGETGFAEVYAIDKNSGATLATLVTQFGVSHVVGGAHHPTRGTLFLIQDRVPGGTDANRVAEVDAQTGAVIQTFQVTAQHPTFTVNFGDIDVAGNGNLLIASSDETTLAEFTPDGAFVAEHTLPVGISGLSGLGVDSGSCSVWVMSTTGVAARLAATPPNHPLCEPSCVADVDDGSGTGTPDGGVTIDDLIYYLTLFDSGGIGADVDDGSFTGTPDGGVTIDDLIYFLDRFDAGC